MNGKKKKYRSLKAIPYGGNYLRLSFKELIILLPLTLLAAFYLLPFLHGKIEKFNFNTPDFRLSYNLRDDYYSYQKWAEYAAENYDVMFIGDSVIWGMYTDNEHTLAHYYNELHEKPIAANLGIDGLHPVALEGLVKHFGGAIKDKKVYLYFNALWLNDPKFDLSGRPKMNADGDLENVAVMHPRLIPQFDYQIAYYDEPLKKRMGNLMEQTLPFYGWTNHLRNVGFNNQPLPQWLNDHPGQSPFAVMPEITDALEYEHVNRSDSWSAIQKIEMDYNWVMPYESRQWPAFLRTAQLLKERDNEVVVLLGAFNTHLLSEESLEACYSLMDYVQNALDDADIKYIVMSELPSETYADASHPLSAGYQLMAEEITEYEEED